MPLTEHTVTSALGAQFDPPEPPGNDAAKKALYKQLKPDFKKKDLAWLKDPDIRVDAPTRVSADDVEWDDYPDWRAGKQLKAVVEIAKKKIHKGKGKPSVVAQAPDAEELKIIDGHHHAMARVDHKEDVLAYVVHVPTMEGPWSRLHDEQIKDKHPDDFPG
jgi:hypothetical protein